MCLYTYTYKIGCFPGDLISTIETVLSNVTNGLLLRFYELISTFLLVDADTHCSAHFSGAPPSSPHFLVLSPALTTFSNSHHCSSHFSTKS